MCSIQNPQTHRFHKAGGTASLLVVLVVVLRWHLQVDRRVRPLGELGVVRVPGALTHWHLAAGCAPPLWMVHTDERSVVRWLVFTGRGGRGCGPGAGGAGRGEAVGSAGVQACYSHNLMSQEGNKHYTQPHFPCTTLWLTATACYSGRMCAHMEIGQDFFQFRERRKRQNRSKRCLNQSKRANSTGETHACVTWCCIRCSGRAVRWCGSSSWLLCLRRHSKLKDGLLLPERVRRGPVSDLMQETLITCNTA